MVSKSSGCLDLSESTAKYALPRNHFNMNKFGRPDEEDFLTVCEVIEKMAGQCTGIMAARAQSTY